MKLEMTKEWFLKRARQEGDAEIGAGLMAFDPTLEQSEANATTEDIQPRIAFGTLVELMRRKRGLTIPKLAEEARVDVTEIMSIERDAHYRPEPRTVYQLASIFSLPGKTLLQLSGNTVVRNDRVREEAVRFAARSGSSAQRLSREEQQALDEFVAFLSRE